MPKLIRTLGWHAFRQSQARVLASAFAATGCLACDDDVRKILCDE